MTAVDRRIGDEGAPVGVEAAAELARLRRAALGVAAAERREPQLGNVGADVLHVALPVLAGADEADADARGTERMRHGGGDAMARLAAKRGPAPAGCIVHHPASDGTIRQQGDRHGLHHHPALPRLRRHRLRRRLPGRLHLRVHGHRHARRSRTSSTSIPTSASTAARASPSARGRRSSRRSRCPTSSRTTRRSTTR